MTATRRSARLSTALERSSVATEASKTASMPPPPLKLAAKNDPTNKRKSPADGSPGSINQEEPTTPKKRRTAAPAASPLPPPVTPTPSAVGLISGLGRPSTTPKYKAVARLADAHVANAQLLSPETSRVVVAASHLPAQTTSSSPSKAGIPIKGPTTTATLLEEACAHLIRVDPRMKPLIEAHHCHIFSPEGLAEKIDPFESLCSGIISQQVSGAAARSIKAKFVALFADEKPGELFPSPSSVAAATIEKLRTAGLSQRKAEYVKGLAEKFASGELSAQLFADLPYEQVLQKLIAVRGLGRWSVEMFACFGLKFMDVFSLGDLGVQRGMAAFSGRDVAKMKNSKAGKWKYMNEKDMTELSDRFKPYRSLFMWYMWRVEETDISTME
ncbi:hypothetical protein MCOR27_011274 [Pyricularia oryzae]|uniref:HhH-GPD domain-containing protein n=3 Tax=Pyricularia TaxID=48558 RepID=A0ABQ8N3S3_PYRGI|nr:DNA-3-methyladenine glycosylase [Pyricularia oryzae 70-15]KAI6252083.1 hypothetical protein MCOR19_011291 [Pyricularia oryzae]KAI6290761.1 hypothetical protein MCOR33_011083 [Pyricularia grisea]EHA52268.1 DNA-3-methyladenine glycosylase [Pyricularia oryzae 70-15]KAI6265804.1 hypothetical protein MCOR27_011274 [Pyricularia oryzae]KAI6269241.1 hypothetical protein MCOR26_008818 [Pyricularia oryzae]